MPRLGPITRRELVARLRQLGFEGPIAGGKHQFMIREQIRLVLPNPHQSQISADLLARILRQAEISRDAWDRL